MADAAEGPSGGRVTAAFLFAATVGALGSGFQYGYNIAVLNAPYQQITEWIGNSSFKDTEPRDTQRKVTIVFSVIVSIFCIGGLIGALLITFTMRHFGLKWGIISTNIFAFIAAACMGFARAIDTYYLMVIGRMIVGIGVGLGAGLTPVYLSTISPVRIRGAIGTFYQLFITIGILIAQIIGLHFVLGNDHWPYLFTMIALVALIQCVFFPLCPDSPEYLYGQGKRTEARNALVRLRGTEDVDDELEEIGRTTAAENAEEEVSMGSLFTRGELRKPLIISCTLMIAQQFSGVNAIMYYSTSTFNAANLGNVSQYGTVMIGLVNVIMTVVSVFILDLLGRRVLLIFSFAAMAIDTLLFFASFMLAVKAQIYWSSYACLLFLILFVVFFAVGAGPIPWVIISELFARGARGKAMTVMVIIHWITNFTLGLTFPMVQDLIGPFVFLIFLVLQTLFLVYIIVAVPETKGRTIAEITALFREP